MYIIANATRVRNAVIHMYKEDAVRLLQALWPDMSRKRAELIWEFPKETRVDGARWDMPESWDSVASDKSPDIVGKHPEKAGV